MAKGGNATWFADCFGWILRPAAQHRGGSDTCDSEQHARLNGHPSGGQVADITHLVGLADASKGPSEFGKVLSFIQPPSHGAAAYELVGELGSNSQGQHGDLKLMRHKRSKEMVAVKMVKRGADAILDKNVEREIINHRRLVHPNVLAFREVFATEDELAIVVEYASAGRLADRCNGERMSEKDARMLFAQLVQGLSYCHSKGVYHRDLRAELLLLSGSVFEPTLKIGGFGYSKSAVLDSMAKTTVGMRGYMAPEVLLSRGTYDAAGVDVWAAGVVLFQMLTGRLPFCHDAHASGCLDHAMMQRIIKGQFYLPGDVALSAEAQDLLARIFTPDPAKRIGLAAMLAHPWLCGAPPLLSASAPQDSRAQPRSDAAGAPASAHDSAPDGLQSEESIVQVIQRARERRLRRINGRIFSGQPSEGRTGMGGSVHTPGATAVAACPSGVAA